MAANHRTVRRRVSIVSTITCDACGTTMDQENDCPDEAITVKHSFGYSSHLDCTYVEADLCALCFERIMRSIPGARWTSH